jgi:hypothetical protein
MTTTELEQALYEFIQPSYPEIDIKVIIDANDIPNIYFTEEKFKLLYPQQRYHYLIHKIPEDFFELHLKDSFWFELAPGESAEDLDYHDDETIEAIKTPILSILQNKIPFVEQLDKEFTSGTAQCFGDFRHSKKLLAELGYADKEEQFDIFHVLMDEGGYCDCEILFNVFKESEYSKQYWRNRK